MVFLMRTSSIWSPNWFQLLHPIGGVIAKPLLNPDAVDELVEEALWLVKVAVLSVEDEIVGLQTTHWRRVATVATKTSGRYIVKVFP